MRYKSLIIEEFNELYFSSVKKNTVSSPEIAVLICAIDFSYSKIVTAYLKNNRLKIKLSPNPFNENATISIDKTVQLKNAEMHLYNVLGEEISSMSSIQTHEFKIQKNSISEGVYFYKIINNAMVIGTGKLIIK